jgi:hypothetical protein
MGLSSLDALNVLDSRFGNGAAAVTNAPATYYLALSTTTPDSDGNNLTEPSGGGYARVAMTNNSTTFDAAQQDQKWNAIVLTFPTATTDWGLCTHFALYDVATGGTPRVWGDLTNAQDIAIGIAPSFPVGAIVITVS